METYIIIGNFKGVNMADVDPDNPGATTEMTKKALEVVGGKMLHLWMTLGRFDFFLVVEVPNSAAVRALVSCLPETIKTETIPAFSTQGDDDSEFSENAKKIMALMSK